MSRTLIAVALTSMLVTPSYAGSNGDTTNTQDKMIDPMTRVDEAVTVAKSAQQDELETAKKRVIEGAEEIKGKYQPKVDAAQSKYDKAKRHTDQGDNYPIETNTERTHILVPTATVRYKEINIPTIHTKMDTTSIPVPTFGSCELKADLPQTKTEWVLKKVGSIFGRPVKMHVPVTTFWFGRTTVPCHKGWGEIKIDLPQFQAGTTILRIPDMIEWDQESWKLNLPQLTVRDYPKQIEDVAKNLSGIEVAISAEIDALETQAQARMVQESVRKVIMEMDTARDDLTQQMEKMRLIFDENVAKIDVAIGQIDAVQGYNTAAIRAVAVGTRDALVQKRDEALKRYQEALAKVETARAALLAEINGMKQAGNDSVSASAAGA